MEIVIAPVMDKTLYQKLKGWVLYVCSKNEGSGKSTDAVLDPLMKSLYEFSEVFAEMKGLPPK